MWDRKHLLDIEAFSRTDIENLIALAKRLEPFSGIDKSKKFKPLGLCSGQIMTLWFEPGKENSTRTFGSFPAAMMRLGGNCKVFDEATSSMTKGESLEDTTRILSGHSDVIVDRHHDADHVYTVASASSVPVINAGNGSAQHPTQTLLDIYTMVKKFGRIEGLKVAVVGDLKYGRTVHSLVKGLEKFGVHATGICPQGLEMPGEFRTAGYEERIIDMNDIGRALSELKPDVVYATRIQAERFSGNSGTYDYIIDKAVLSGLPKNAVIMHPLPRISELSREIDADERSIYFHQADNGVPVRMAILCLLLDHEFE
ncbi:MAG: aspartate carbamoyltransferase [Candidatus Aenigmarchaeota archaeon]|nr:aspartate carbamoyltransferase [Candidatus Aenigmarchaeota archaeon]